MQQKGFKHGASSKNGTLAPSSVGALPRFHQKPVAQRRNPTSVRPATKAPAKMGQGTPKPQHLNEMGGDKAFHRDPTKPITNNKAVPWPGAQRCSVTVCATTHICAMMSRPTEKVKGLLGRLGLERLKTHNANPCAAKTLIFCGPALTDQACHLASTPLPEINGRARTGSMPSWKCRAGSTSHIPTSWMQITRAWK